jgi:hypothetical protein
LQSVEKIEKAPCIWVYKNSFDSKNICDLLEKESEKDWPYLSWNKSATGQKDNTLYSEYRTSLEMDVSSLFLYEIEESLKTIQKIMIEDIFKPINNCIWDYRNCHSLHLQGEEGFRVLKYSGGGEYHIHHDHHPVNARVLSLVACLGGDFEGGELEFNNFDVSIKLEKNSVILFPSNFPYTHIAHPVPTGTKYSLVTWFS